MKYFTLLHSAYCLLGGLTTLREGFVTERNNGATFEILSGTSMLKCDLSKWTEWSSCRQLGTACRNIQTRLRRCKGNEKYCCDKARRNLSEIRKCDNFETEWSEWSPCTETCGSNSSRSRSAQNCNDQQNEPCRAETEGFNVECPETEEAVLKADLNSSDDILVGTGEKSGLWWPPKSSETLNNQNIKLEEKFSMSDFIPVLKLIEALGPDAIQSTTKDAQCQSEWKNCYHQVVNDDSIGQKWSLDEQSTSTECISFETKSSSSSVCFCF